MKKKSIIISLIFCSLAMLLAGCNDDVFIKPLEVSPADGSLGPDCTSMHISVSGEQWHIRSVSFISDLINTSIPGESGEWNLTTPFVALSVHEAAAGVDVILEQFVSNEKGSLYITVEDDYDDSVVVIDITPTDAFTIDIKNVTYTLNSWGGYPDEDFDYDIPIRSYPHGLSEPEDFAVPELRSLPVLYLFRGWNDDVFENKVLNSWLPVPVPTYNYGSVGWIMRGETAKLTSNRSYFDTSYFPEPPKTIALPAGRPLAVGLIVRYECVSLDCCIDVVSPGSGETRTIDCKLLMWVPMTIDSQVSFL